MRPPLPEPPRNRTHRLARRFDGALATTVVALAIAFCFAVALWPQATFPDLGHALAARGYIRTVWVVDFIPCPPPRTGACGRTLGHGDFHPGTPWASNGDYTARYGMSGRVNGSAGGGELNFDINEEPCRTRLVNTYGLAPDYHFTAVDLIDTNYVAAGNGTVLTTLFYPACATAPPPPQPTPTLPAPTPTPSVVPTPPSPPPPPVCPTPPPPRTCAPAKRLPSLPAGCSAIAALASKPGGPLVILTWHEDRAAKVRECAAWLATLALDSWLAPADRTSGGTCVEVAP